MSHSTKFILLCKRNWLNKVKRYIKKQLVDDSDIEDGVYAAAKAGNIELFEYLVSYGKITLDIYHCIINCAFNNSKIKMFNHLLTRKYDNIINYEKTMEKIIYIAAVVSRKNMAFIYSIINLGKRPGITKWDSRLKRFDDVPFWNIKYEPIKRCKYLANIGFSNHIYPNSKRIVYTHGTVKLKVNIIITI